MVLKDFEYYQLVSYLISPIFLRFLDRPFLSYLDFWSQAILHRTGRGIQAIDLRFYILEVPRLATDSGKLNFMRANNTCIADHIWPVGRSLDNPDLIVISHHLQ